MTLKPRRPGAILKDDLLHIHFKLILRVTILQARRITLAKLSTQAQALGFYDEDCDVSNEDTENDKSSSH